MWHVVGTAGQVCACVCVTEQGTGLLWENQRRVCWLVGTHSQWPVACHQAPAVSLSVFLLITHHSTRGKASHKLQRIVPRRSACHHAAPRFRVRLIVDREQSWGGRGGTHTHTHTRTHTQTQRTCYVYLHAHPQINLNRHTVSVSTHTHTHTHTGARPISPGAS